MSYNYNNNNNYGYDNSNPYADQYELDTYDKNGDDFVGFMNEIKEINENLDNYSNVISEIATVQKSLLNEISEEQEEYSKRRLDAYISEATSVQQLLRSKIKNVQTLALHDAAKTAQAETSRDRFLKLIESYRLVEADYREQNRIQAERQYRIIKPNASDSEVKEAIDDAGGQQIFSQALLQSNRRGEAKTALHEVQQRHRELQKLEKTMAELTQLFHDMEELVVEQNAPIQQIDEQVEVAQHDIEQGVGHTQKAVVSAKKARRRKLWCFGICVLIVIILAAVLAGVLATRH